MKKILLLFTVVFTTACSDDGTKPPDYKMGTGLAEKGQVGYGIKVFEFEYDHHRYIQFGQVTTAWGVHSPECDCQKK
jgi:hypothetical protein